MYNERKFNEVIEIYNWNIARVDYSEMNHKFTFNQVTLKQDAVRYKFFNFPNKLNENKVLVLAFSFT